MDFPDINVWFALAVEDHPQHLAAKEYWYGLSSSRFAFCRVTSLGFLRLLTNRTAMSNQPFSVVGAWQAYQAFRTLPEVSYLSDDPLVDRYLEVWLEQGTVTHRLWTDAYLAALSASTQCRLVSFDTDFYKFSGLDCLILASEQQGQH
jgi:toxin-antitoxin system PIN domain toxin